MDPSFSYGNGFAVDFIITANTPILHKMLLAAGIFDNIVGHLNTPPAFGFGWSQGTPDWWVRYAAVPLAMGGSAGLSGGNVALAVQGVDFAGVANIAGAPTIGGAANATFTPAPGTTVISGDIGSSAGVVAYMVRASFKAPQLDVGLLRVPLVGPFYAGIAIVSPGVDTDAVNTVSIAAAFNRITTTRVPANNNKTVTSPTRLASIQGQQINYS
jgi:hypothetical protein